MTMDMYKLEIIGKYKLDIEQIDTQHQYLFDILNRLNALIQNRGSEEDLDLLIKDFLSYTVFHFKDEEEFMRSQAYPKLAEHIKIHEGFVKMATDVVEKYRGSKFLRFKFFHLVMDLLLNHIEKVDHEFAVYYKNKQAKGNLIT
jgi:hemerythrin-like metal-binding protein